MYHGYYHLLNYLYTPLNSQLGLLSNTCYGFCGISRTCHINRHIPVYTFVSQSVNCSICVPQSMLRLIYYFRNSTGSVLNYKFTNSRQSISQLLTEVTLNLPGSVFLIHVTINILCSR